MDSHAQGRQMTSSREIALLFFLVAFIARKCLELFLLVLLSFASGHDVGGRGRWNAMG